MYQLVNAHLNKPILPGPHRGTLMGVVNEQGRFIIDGAVLLPYINDEKPLTDLAPVIAAHVALLRDEQALQAVTRSPAATFADLDLRSQAIYRAIGEALSGCVVYATGSRVKGSWRSGAPDDPKTVIATRLGKPAESDVDVIVLGADGERGSLWDGPTFCQAVAPVAAAFGVRIDRQPATLQPQIPVPKAEAHLIGEMRSKAEE